MSENTIQYSASVIAFCCRYHARSLLTNKNFSIIYVKLFLDSTIFYSRTWESIRTSLHEVLYTSIVTDYMNQYVVFLLPLWWWWLSIKKWLLSLLPLSLCIFLNKVYFLKSIMVKSTIFYQFFRCGNITC